MGFVALPNPQHMDPYQPPLKPAPIMHVMVHHALRKEMGYALLRAFLDTGADQTWLGPQSLTKLETAIGPLPLKSLKTAGGLRWYYDDLGFSFDGGLHWYYPDPDRRVRCAVTRTEYDYAEDMLIGRDVLCQFQFCCDGPNAQFTLKDPQHC